MPASDTSSRVAPVVAAGAARVVDAAVSPDPVSAADGHTHVMVVEDDRDTREVVKLILELDGMDVTEASDGFEALDRLHSLRERDPLLPCVIVLDIMMPRCSGPEFRRRQLNDPLISDVPIIVLSAIADQTRLEDLQPYAKVQKPFDPDQLIQVVRAACDRQTR